MTKEERERLKRFVPMREMPILIEGERPGETVLTAEGKIEKRVLPPVEEWKDVAIGNMTITDRDELWGHNIYCNKCGTYFQARAKKDEEEWNVKNVFNFCPGCGSHLVDRRNKKTVEQIKKILED